MAWVKIPAEHHPIFLAALPKHPAVTSLKMFGGIAAKANGQMFAGLFARSFIVKLSEQDHAEAMALDGAEQFDPMGNGRVMTNTVLMPEDTFGDDAELKAWLRRALDYTLTLPAKAITPKDKPTAKAEPKAAAKAEAKSATKVEAKVATTAATKLQARSATPAAKPEAKSATKPAATPVAKAAAKKPAAKKR